MAVAASVVVLDRDRVLGIASVVVLDLDRVLGIVKVFAGDKGVVARDEDVTIRGGAVAVGIRRTMGDIHNATSHINGIIMPFSNH